MKKTLSILTVLLLASLLSFSQKGQVWATETRQEFDIDSDGNITKEYKSNPYYSYYLFINNNEFIHCTNSITSLYKINSRTESKDFVDYVVVSEVGNTYHMRFSQKDSYVVITSLANKFSVYIGCYKPYNTKVFNNINR